MLTEKGRKVEGILGRLCLILLALAVLFSFPAFLKPYWQVGVSVARETLFGGYLLLSSILESLVVLAERVSLWIALGAYIIAVFVFILYVAIGIQAIHKRQKPASGQNLR